VGYRPRFPRQAKRYSSRSDAILSKGCQLFHKLLTINALTSGVSGPVWHCSVEFHEGAINVLAMELRDPQLDVIARGVVWWEPPEVTLSDQNDFLCRVMCRGSWEDVQHVEKVYGEEALRRALGHAKPGVFDPASWHYWHYRLGFESVPELPRRPFV
jgi:hypothetical protein